MKDLIKGMNRFLLKTVRSDDQKIMTHKTETCEGDSKNQSRERNLDD